MSYGARDRRPLFGAHGSKEKVDVESLERENDSGIDGLSERVTLLREATKNIKGEADAQHRVLDGIADTMGHTRLSIGGAADKFKMVMMDKGNRKMITIVCGSVAALLLLYFMLKK